jgi:hypothetical protein
MSDGDWLRSTCCTINLYTYGTLSIGQASECRATEAQEIFADNTSDYLETIEQSQCISFAFLSEMEPFEIKLKQYCQEKYQDFDTSFMCQPCRPNFFQNSFQNDDSWMLSCTLFQGKSMATFLKQFCGFIKVRKFWRIMFDKMSGTCTRVKTMSVHCSAKYVCRSCWHFQSVLRKCLTIAIGYR